jgi:hypothetical protein
MTPLIDLQLCDRCHCGSTIAAASMRFLLPAYCQPPTHFPPKRDAHRWQSAPRMHLSEPSRPTQSYRSHPCQRQIRESTWPSRRQDQPVVLALSARSRGNVFLPVTVASVCCRTFCSSNRDALPPYLVQSVSSYGVQDRRPRCTPGLANRFSGSRRDWLAGLQPAPCGLVGL